MTRQSTRTFLGIDAGGTQTLAVVISEDGDVLGLGKGGPANHVSLGEDVARRSVALAVEEAFGGLSLLPATVAFGSAGLEAPGDLDTARRLLPESLRSLPIIFDTDAIMSLEGALGGDPGIVVAAGTGAIAYGRDESGRRVGVGGWGWRIGDEGSAYWLATEALRAICKAEDGRGPLTVLTAMVLDELNLPDSQALLEWVYVPERTPDDIARLAPVVEAAAVSGDSVADWLLTKAAEELADAVEAVARRLGCLDRLGVRVSISGGVFRSQNHRGRYRADIERRGISADVHEPVLAPVAGAAIQAWRLGQVGSASSPAFWTLEVPESLVAKLKAHMPGLGPEKGGSMEA